MKIVLEDIESLRQMRLYFLPFFFTALVLVDYIDVML